MYSLFIPLRKELSFSDVPGFADNHHSVRSVRYRYTLTSDGQEEFYDHAIDPNEWRNLAGINLDYIQKLARDWLKSELLYLKGRGPEPEIPVGLMDVIPN
jgi:hypothetical protein